MVESAAFPVVERGLELEDTATDPPRLNLIRSGCIFVCLWAPCGVMCVHIIICSNPAYR